MLRWMQEVIQYGLQTMRLKYGGQRKLVAEVGQKITRDW
ncbi:hypothetical protein BN59_01561 [Legionella massiliensis]|uniref:Uncharacterized protein n=1 Tax=Legionella massiliensis TaxID=1034943 RepID=A0A078KZQ1_9GAMM|nr:hypothetical protein BN59_01561 [Legionella massiliensis]CEE13017.1 hypothetical protein BN1094_01561 [Legionella massiliensis]